MSYTRVGAVTGANKGIGYAIVRQLALQYPKSPLNNGPLLVYLTARDQGRGEEAVRSLSEDPALKQAKALKQDGGLTDVKFHALDIDQTDSIRTFAEHLKKSHPDGIDFVINNAGVALDGFDNNIVKKTIECNYYGTLEATQDFLPILRDDSKSRLINVSSIGGRLNKYSPAIQDRFISAQSTKDVTKLMEDFKAAVKADRVKEEGWTTAAYSASKAGVTCMTAQVAAEHKSKGGKALINSCCPGWVSTDMTKNNGAKTPDQGAATPVLLALEDIGGKTGLWWQSPLRAARSGTERENVSVYDPRDRSYLN